jgi:transcriptional regulator with XRE-family HTH domain/Zn-dependent peptidase ImmA (M78 family)
MIKNDRQFRITKAQAEKFETAVRELEQRGQSPRLHPLLQKAHVDALKSQLADLRDELREYEELRSGKRKSLSVDSFGQLGRALIQARVASGMSQKQLADKLGLKEQQIQRYEATEYQTASVARIQDIIRALGIAVREDIFLPSAIVSMDSFLKRMRSVGLDEEFLQKRIVGMSADEANGNTATLALTAASTVSHVFGWPSVGIFTDRALPMDASVIGAARFKVAKSVDRVRLHAYTVYAHYLALVLLGATTDLPRRPLPNDAQEFRASVLRSYGALTLDAVLRYVWSLGIPVLPLADPGAFHGACWRVDGRNVIVLKQKTAFVGRWLFDLLHEYRHAAENPDGDLAIVEAEETQQDQEELVASQFAGDVLLDGRAEELAERCVEAAQGKVEWLKAAVPKVAAKEKVSVDALANYMAFRLSLQHENWWGTANNLQVTGANPWLIARDILLENVALGNVNDLDRNLLVNALS